MPDEALVEAIRALLAASPFHGEGYRKIWARLRFAGIRTSKRRELPDEDLTESPRKVREIENAWIVLADGCRLAARIWFAGGCGAGPGAGDSEVSVLSQARRHGRA